MNCYATGVGNINIAVKPLTVDFLPGLPGDFVSDTIRFVTTSNAQTYRWKFTPAASVAASTHKDPGFITYASAGRKSIQLTATSSIGCVDSVTREMEIADKTSTGHYDPCYDEQVFVGASVLDQHLDKNGNVYIAGYKRSEQLQRYDDLFFAKIDSTGKKAWSKALLPSSYKTTYGTGIATDNEGNVYVVGHATGYTFELGKLYSWIGHNIHGYAPYMFILKLNKSGEEQWLITAITTDTAWPYEEWVVASDIAIDANNRIYVTGHRSLAAGAEIRFPDGNTKTLVSVNDDRSAREGFLLELDSAGAMEHYVEFGGGQSNAYWLTAPLQAASLNGWHDIGSDRSINVAVNPKIKIDHDGDILLGGVFEAKTTQDPIEFGRFKLYTVRGEDPDVRGSYHNRGSTFIAEYNKEQGWKSAVRGVSLGVNHLQEFAKDTDGNIYTVGGLGPEAIIHGDTIKRDQFSYRPPYSYLAKINAYGYVAWSAISQSAYLHDVAVSKQGTIFVTGEIDRFGALYDGNNKPFGMVSEGKRDGILGEYTADGTLLWIQATGKAGSDQPFYMDADACDNLYISSGTSSWPLNNYAGVATVSKLSPFGNCTKTACSNELTLLSFDPQEGTEGDPVHITGSNFRYVTAVMFNGVQASFTVESDALITATVPATATTGTINVSTHNESVTSAEVFMIDKLAFIDFTPRHGVAGSMVTVYGRNIDKVQQVTFNSTTTTDFTVVNDTTLSVRVPQGATTGFIGVSGGDEADASAEVFTVDVITGNEGERFRNCVLYPNPTSGLVTLDCHTLRGMSYVEVFNMLGVRVAHQTIEGSVSGNVLDLKYLSAGLYHVVLFNDAQRREYKLVKE